ncbi:MAG: LAGLIDADG family homing endonuclease [Candidatus Caldarchaeales archaeon]
MSDGLVGPDSAVSSPFSVDESRRNSTKGGRRIPYPATLKQRVLTLAAAGHRPAEIRRTLLKEGIDLPYPSIYNWVRKHFGARFPRSSPDLWCQIYYEVLRLRDDGATYRQIIAEIWRKFNIKLPRGTLWGWIKGHHKPRDLPAPVTVPRARSTSSIVVTPAAGETTKIVTKPPDITASEHAEIVEIAEEPPESSAPDQAEMAEIVATTPSESATPEHTNAEHVKPREAKEIIYRYVWMWRTYKDIILRKALEYRQQGLSLSEIVRKLEEEKIYIAERTLESWFRDYDILGDMVFKPPIYTWKHIKDSIELRERVLNRAAELRRQGLPYYRIRAELRREGIHVHENSLIKWLKHMLGETPERQNEILKRVRELNRMGLGYRRITKELAKDGLRFHPSTIDRWLRGETLPRGLRKPGRKPERNTENESERREDSIVLLEPSPELAYIIGVMMGDGYTYRTADGLYVLVLVAKDREFVEEFSRCVEMVLRRPAPAVEKVMRNGTVMYRAQVRSRVLYELVARRQIEKIRPFVEFNDACRAAFLRGFFDAEGCASSVGVEAYNTDVRILTFVQEQLSALKIETTGPHLHRRGGDVKMISDHPAISKKDLYRIRIRYSSLRAFAAKVGFVIPRKLAKLRDKVMRTEESRRTQRTDSPPSNFSDSRLSIIIVY